MRPRVLGLDPNTQLHYRAGDQPNNAFGLGVTDPGSVAVNAGTSGVVYALSDEPIPDPSEMYNVFVHVNHHPDQPRNGLLFCLNGCGILYAQLKALFGANSYLEMNELAASVPIGSEGLRILPFGNGAERMLGNRNPGASAMGWDLNRHRAEHWYRAAAEGVAASLAYGIERMRQLEISIQTVRAGRANLFLNPIFIDTFVHFSKADLELLPADGAVAAAIGAAMGPAAWNLLTAARSNDTVSFRPTHSSEYDTVRDEYFSMIETLIQTHD